MRWYEASAARELKNLNHYTREENDRGRDIVCTDSVSLLQRLSWICRKI